MLRSPTNHWCAPSWQDAGARNGGHSDAVAPSNGTLPMLAPTSLARPAFFGAWVIRAAFVLAMFGWGVGLYGPPIFLHAVVERTGWPLVLVSSAVTAISNAALEVASPPIRLRSRVVIATSSITISGCRARMASATSALWRIASRLSRVAILNRDV